MKNNTVASANATVAATAAVNASAAANAAANAAAKAAENATIAAKAASESATAIAVVATDTSWMKKSLGGIENTLDEMQKNYVTAAQHLELCKNIDDHERRLNHLEKSNLRLNVLITIGIGILSLLTTLLIYHLFQS